MTHSAHPSRLATTRKIRECCVLGLPTAEVVQRVAPLVRDAVGAGFVSYSWVDRNHEIRNHYLLDPQFAPTARLYFARYYNRGEREVVPGYSELLRSRTPLLNSLAFEPSLLRSEMFNELLAPAGLRHILRVAVADEKVHGSMTVARGPDGAPFSPADERFMTEVSRWLAHASAAGASDCEHSEGGEEGTVLAAADGRVLHLCATARRLAFLLANSQVAPGRDWHEDGLKPLARELATLIGDGDNPRPPARRVTNHWGRFSLHARWLVAPGGDTAPLIGVTLRRAVPASLRLLDGMDALRLSERERQVCLLFAEGKRQEEIAARLGITPNTVTTHVRRIYEKTGTSQRDALLRHLLLMPQADEETERSCSTHSLCARRGAPLRSQVA